MIRLAALAAMALVLGGCEPARPRPQEPQTLEVLHDDARGVTCWQSSKNYITLSCLPDWMLKPQKKPVRHSLQCDRSAPGEPCMDEFARAWPNGRPDR